MIEIFPEQPLRILDVGAGENPFEGRANDQIVTVDFDHTTSQTIVCDFVHEWPFKDEEFDFIYASHVIEHLYAQDRDRVINSIFRSLKREGLLFIRVPHQSSIQGTGWEHHTLYGLNAFYSLTHGKNPYLPMMELISIGAYSGSIDKFNKRRRLFSEIIDRILNKSHRITDLLLCFLIGGIPEIQVLLRKP
ncbi:methyltransferase domain-containing protein [Azospirillum sp. B506]|uniref:methyltransferase domain-containing protein n=1 Tax=Azospirillum sp. B506 TaxID=137721 RepID=UPI00131EE74C|nr:methyltransferase domain-containing protein [Azospirillum sp. B506]